MLLHVFFEVITMINRNEKIKIDPDFWEKVQIFDGSDIPKADQNALWEDIFALDWNPYKRK